MSDTEDKAPAYERPKALSFQTVKEFAEQPEREAKTRNSDLPQHVASVHH